jgi:hypothetical protein
MAATTIGGILRLYLDNAFKIVKGKQVVTLGSPEECESYDRLLALCRNSFGADDTAGLKCAIAKVAVFTDSTLVKVQRLSLAEFVGLLEKAIAAKAEGKREGARTGREGTGVSGWVPAVHLWKEKFSTYKELAKFRRQHPEMFQNPSHYKLDIHAGLWAQYWAKQDRAGFEALSDDVPPVADDPEVQAKTLAAAMRKVAQLRAKKKAEKR